MAVTDYVTAAPSMVNLRAVELVKAIGLVRQLNTP